MLPGEGAGRPCSLEAWGLQGQSSSTPLSAPPHRDPSHRRRGHGGHAVRASARKPASPGGAAGSGGPRGAGDHFSVLKRLGWVLQGLAVESPGHPLVACPHSWTPSLQERGLRPHWAVPGRGLELHTCGPLWQGRAPSPVVEVRPPEDQRSLADPRRGGLQKMQTVRPRECIHEETRAKRRQPCSVFIGQKRGKS